MKPVWNILLVSILAAPVALRADTYKVSVNTSALAAGSYTLAFEFTDGSGTDDANNTATINNLDFGGGSVSNSAVFCGGDPCSASGDVTSGFSIADSSFYNFLEQQFTPGNALSFMVSLTNYSDSGGTPDEFSFYIEELATTDTVGGSLLTIDIGGAVTPYSSSQTGTTSVASASAVPEPGTFTLLLAGLAGLANKRLHRVR